MALLTIQHLSKSFGDYAALSDVDLTIESGRIIGLLGKNGAGKTTLLKLICDLLTPTEGQVLFEDAPSALKANGKSPSCPNAPILTKA